MSRWLTLSTVLVLAAAFAGGCDQDPGTFMLDSFKQNIRERLDNVEQELDVIASTPATPTTRAWINDRRTDLAQARERLASIDRDVETRGYVARTDLTERTRELELAVERGGPTEPEDAGG